VSTGKGPLLLVDDTPANREMLSRRLERLGYIVVLAASGPEALQVVAEQRIRLVLLDVEMPGMSGLDVLSTLRQRYSPIELPVIMVTARQQREDIIQALTLGANDYVTKPIDLPIAAARIQTQLSLSQSEAALRESEERYALAARGANDGLWDWNLASGSVYFSPRWKLMLGSDEDEIGTSPDEWFTRIHPDDVARVRSDVNAHLKGATPQFESEHRLMHRDGAYRWMLVRGLAIRDDNGRPSRFAGSLTDITEGKVSDPLTGLPNRLLFLDRLERAVQRRKRDRGNLYAVLFLDLDRFKFVNDSLGHLSGDRLLVAISRRLQHCLRATDRRDVLRLHADTADPAVQRQIQGLRAVKSAAIVRRLPLPGPLSFGRGLEIDIELDEAAFEGASALAFGSVLEHFLAKYASINSFTEVVLRGSAQGELVRFPARIGRRRSV
jgi:PAS domain S-box-containing protein